MTRPNLIVVDAFYTNPDSVRERAVRMEYREPDYLTGWRTRAYHPNGVRSRIERKFALQIGYWEEDIDAIEAGNGVFFSAYSTGGRRETVSVHFDSPSNWLTLLVYLTPRAPVDAGTSMWRHRSTGLSAKPMTRDARRLGTSVKQLYDLLEKDSRDSRKWIEIDRIGNVYNRAVLFPSGLLHSATRHFGNNTTNGRLYHCFHFSGKPAKLPFSTERNFLHNSTDS